MLIAVYPGSFDPPTNGHLNLINRASKIFDSLKVVIAVNPSKKYLFSSKERVAMMKLLLKGYKNVSVDLWDKLIVDFASREKARVILRGVRAIADFGHEFELSMLNKGLNSGIETVFMPTDPKYFVLRSAAIKELAILGGDISKMVPPEIERALKIKLDR